MNATRLPKLGIGALLLAVAAAAGCNKSVTQTTPSTSPPAAMTVEPAAAPSPPAPFATPPVLPGSPDVASLVARVRTSVVNITSEHDVKIPRIDPGDLFGFEPFGGLFGRREHGGPRPPEQLLKQRALGTGILIDSSGHVVTNAHVVEGADVVRVKLADDREFKAKVKGRDRRLDLALLELEGAADLPAASLGSSEALRVGEYVVAIGNPFGLGHTVTMGIVSAKSRALGAGPYDDFIQTDASINPGNSGGPLFNLRGEVVGINTAINPAGRGIGFAIPVDALKYVLPQLLTKGYVERGRLGVVIQPVDAPLAKALDLDRPRGALVAEVEPGGPAEKAGLAAGDVILSIDGVDVPSSQDLPRLVARHAPGSKVSLKVLRKHSEKTIEAELDVLKDSGPSELPATIESQAGLGIELGDARGGGALVERVRPHSAAGEALEPGDVIVEVNQEKVSTAKEAAARIARAEKSPPVLLKIKRGGKARFVAIDGSKTP
jgi:serine protease Do